VHSYATDVDRSKVTLVLGAGSVGIAYLLYWAIHAAGVASPWWIDIPGPLGIAAVMFAIYDRAGWRWRFGPLRLSTIPDLSGTWEGSVRSDYDDGENVQTGILRISQHWTSIRVRYEPAADSSSSTSVVAAVLTAEDDPTLVYEYINEPGPFAAPAMTPHRGLARLQVKQDGRLAGDYYTGRLRKTAGAMDFHRR